MTDLLVINKPINDPLSYCNYILPHVSRSFALGINTLSGQTRKSVLIGYLLCRIADTIEDDVKLSAEKKCLYLEEFVNCFSDKKKSSFISEIGHTLHGNSFHLDLVKNTHLVFDSFYALSKNSQSILIYWIKEMCFGMIKFIKKYPFGIRIADITEYKEYCYYVAGTVGYMLTDIWKEYAYFIGPKRYEILNKSAGIFGEALQSVNILKDIAWDIENENAIFIPQSNLTELSVHEIVNLTANNMDISLEYIQNIPRINTSVRFFCIFPLLLAIATLREIKRSPSILKPLKKIKVSRDETKQIYKNAYLASFSNCWLRKTANKIRLIS
ncbi:MAG: squalene/phytoene synthase family protein [Bdellovibrionota bacterium]